MKKQSKSSTTKAPKKARVLMVIPTLGDRLDLLRETLESVTSQTPKPDLVVVLPLKNKAACKLAKEYGAELVEDPRSLSGALNVGFAAAKPWHEFGAWMGDDDLLRPDALKTTLSALDKHPDAILAYGYCDYVDTDGNVLFTSRAGALAPWLMTWGPNLLPLPGLLYRLDAARSVGEYIVEHKYAMDLDMWLRLRKKGKFINTKKVVGAFRWHPTSITVANRNASLGEAAMIKRQHLPKLLKPVAPVWELPVKATTHIAVKRLNKKAKKLAK
jgi:GT2 family glycosyltransferase